MKGYLDTCIISAIVKADIKEVEQVALVKLKEKYIANQVELFTTPHQTTSHQYYPCVS